MDKALHKTLKCALKCLSQNVFCSWQEVHGCATHLLAYTRTSWEFSIHFSPPPPNRKGSFLKIKVFLHLTGEKRKLLQRFVLIQDEIKL